MKETVMNVFDVCENNIAEHIEGHENNIAKCVGGDEKNIAEFIREHDSNDSDQPGH
jgi:hypothetical protein